MNALFDVTDTGTAETIVPSAVILPGGDLAIFCFDRLPFALPERGGVQNGTTQASWIAKSWPGRQGHAAVALVDAACLGQLQLTGTEELPALRIGVPAAVSTEAATLAAFISDSEAQMVEALRFLGEALVGPGRPETAHQFHAALLLETSQPDGFIELVVRPDCGGFFLQGWAHTSLSGWLPVLGAGEGLVATAAPFDRDDILAPAAGFCLFVIGGDGPRQAQKALFIEHDNRVLRLDMLATAEPIEGLAANEHVKAMLPRIDAPEDAMEAFRRIVRPRFEGTDTLSAHSGPTTAAVDRVLYTASGGIFLTGWVLDPLQQVDRVILKSTAGLYEPLHTRWHRLDRPDLNDAFGTDPRFAGLLDPRERLHGFVCAAQVDPAKMQDAEVYLELVLKDDGCLFLPCMLTSCAGVGGAHPVLATLAPSDPALSTLIREHAAPFLTTLPRESLSATHLSLQPLAGGPRGHTVAALLPVTDIAHLQVMMACLAGAPEADQIDLMLIAGRDGSIERSEELDRQFRFYGLSGSLVLVPEHETLAGRLDAGASASDAPELLVWQSAALPKAPGWLDTLRLGTAEIEGSAVVAPLLTYEDGSVYYGGSPDGVAPEGAVCPLVGFERLRVADRRPRRARTIPAELALIDRPLLENCGGFRGGLWGDRYIAQDLSQRLIGNGAEAWCIPAAEFWMLDAAPQVGDPGQRNIIDRLDTALIDCRADQSKRVPMTQLHTMAPQQEVGP